MGKPTSKSRLRAFWKPGGQVHAPSERKLRAWLKQNGLGHAPGNLTLLLHAPAARGHRVRAVRALLDQNGK